MQTIQYSILVVDDESMIKRSLKMMIEEQHKAFRVAGDASTGKEALELMERLSPDIVITDIRMPVMNGLKLLHELKHKYDSVEVVILSGYDDFDYIQQALRLGAADYLLKPIKPRNVRKALLRIYNRLQQKEKQALSRMECLAHSKPLAGRLAETLWLLDKAHMLSALEDIHRCYTVHAARAMPMNEFYFHILVWVDEELAQHHYDSCVISRETAAEVVHDKHFGYSAIETFLSNLLDTLEHNRNRMVGEMVRKAIQYMEHNYGIHTLAVQDISRHIGFSESHLRNVFKKETGCSIIQYLSKIRLEAAKARLSDPYAKALEIAMDTGFPEYAHFCRAFRKYTGVSPSEYRKRTARISD